MWAVNGALAAVLAGSVAWAVASVGDPTANAASTQRTASVATGTVTATVSASGNVSTKRSVGVDFTGSGGIVRAIYVRQGQRVTAGQRLARIDDTSAQQSLRSAQAALASARAQYLTATQGQSAADRERSAAQVAAAKVTLANAQTSLQQAKDSRALDRKQQDALVAAAQDTLDRATGDAARQSAQSSLRQARNTRDATLLRDDQAVENARGQVASARAALASQQAAAAADAQPARQGSVRTANAQIATAQVQVDQARTALDQTVLRAPAAGTVASISGVVGESSAGGASSGSASGSTGSGGASSSASAGSTASSASSASGFVVLTDLGTLQVTANVAEADIARVRVGQQATVSFPASGTTTPGEVTAVDVQQTVSNNVVQYGVTVTLDTPSGGSGTVKLGQTASISITTATKKDVLTVPSSAVTTVGGVSTVSLPGTDGATRTTPVEVGISGNGLTEVVSGLKSGDRVVLPNASTAGGFTFPGGGPGLGAGLGR